MDQEVDQTYVFFSGKKICIGQFGHFGLKNDASS